MCIYILYNMSIGFNNIILLLTIDDTQRLENFS